MIHTLTLNPAVDYVVYIDELTPGHILRSGRESVFIGGKGINVSLILKEHGLPSVAMGFVAGFTGQAVIDELTAHGVTCDFVMLSEGCTRINLKIRSGKETDINARGPVIPSAALDALFAKMRTLTTGDTLVLAGSVPPSLPYNIYEQIMEITASKEIRYVVDTTGPSLLCTLKHRPFLIKPNHEELGDIFSVRIGSADEALRYAGELQRMGAMNVLVSLGGDGAVLLDENGQSHRIHATPGRVINTVGAGDSMVAGFLAGYLRTGDFAKALRVGEASGSATAFSEGLADGEAIRALLCRQS